jgi:transglutaminase-like putative cysteine protease
VTTTRQKGMIWVLATLAIASIPQWLAMPAHLAVICLACVLWRLAAELRRWKPPGSAVRVTLTLVCVLLLVLSFGGLVGRRAAVSLLTLMLSLKLLECFRVRDARIVASLSLFLCATQFLFSQDMPMLVYAACTLIASLVSLALLHRREAFAGLGDAPPTGHSIFTELGFTIRLLAFALPGAVAVFLLFPRWSSPLWGVPENALDARSGLSNSMTPGSIQGLFMDDSPAFRADFDGELPPHQSLYWRGPVLWNFDGRTWSRFFYAQSIAAESHPDAATAPWRYRVQLEPHEQHWLFALDYPAIIPRGARLGMDYQLTSRRPITQLMSYEMASDPQFVDAPVLRSAFRRAALELPADFNPRTLEMMRQWRGETPDDRQLIARVLNWFNQEEFRYTLNPELLSRHTVDEFLFRTRSGFCEHYASAFTVMMRMGGIPARIVTGYQGGWFNESGGYVLVRQSDAHAWSEVWLPESGWTRVDPTAAVSPERIENGAMDALAGRRHLLDFAWVRSMRNSLDLLQSRWNDWIIAFNADRQSRLFSPLGVDRLDPVQLTALLLAATAVVSLLILPIILRMRVSRKIDRNIRAWHVFRKRLARCGLEIAPGIAPLELAALAGSQMHQERSEIDRIADLYTRIRYADQQMLSTEFIQAVRSFRPEKPTR